MPVRTIHNIKKFTEIVNNNQIFAGVDVHKNTYSVSLLCPAKLLNITFSTPNTNMGFIDEQNNVVKNVINFKHEKWSYSDEIIE